MAARACWLPASTWPPGGVLAVWSYAESSPFADALEEVFDEVRIEPISHDNRLIDERQTDWLFFARG